MAKKVEKEKKAPRVSVKVVSASEAKATKKTQKTARASAAKSHVVESSAKTVKSEAKDVKTVTSAKSKSKRRNPLRHARKLGLIGKIFLPFTMFARYVVNAWRELRKVHWPNRKLSWQYTLAVLIFSVFFGGLIFGFDALFTYLFKEIII